MIGTARLNGLDPEAYLREVLTGSVGLLPWQTAPLRKKKQNPPLNLPAPENTPQAVNTVLTERLPESSMILRGGNSVNLPSGKAFQGMNRIIGSITMRIDSGKERCIVRREEYCAAIAQSGEAR